MKYVVIFADGHHEKVDADRLPETMRKPGASSCVPDDYYALRKYVPGVGCVVVKPNAHD